MYPALFQPEVVTRPPGPARNAAPGGEEALVVEADSATTQWIELKKRCLALRGEFAGKNGKAIPRTTNHDILQLATMWTGELGRVSIDEDRDRSEKARWQACLEEVAASVDPKAPDAEYPHNEVFWSASRRLAIYLESRKMRPSKWSLLASSVKEAIAEVPGTLGRAGRSAAGATARVLTDPVKLAMMLVGAVGVAIILPPILASVRK
jgi:hypothetical protein